MRDRLARNCRLTAVSTQVYNAIKGWIEGDRDAENEDGNGFSMDAMLDGAGGGADSARTRRPEAAETAPGDGDEASGADEDDGMPHHRARKATVASMLQLKLQQYREDQDARQSLKDRVYQHQSTPRPVMTSTGKNLVEENLVVQSRDAREQAIRQKAAERDERIAKVRAQRAERWSVKKDRLVALTHRKEIRAERERLAAEQRRAAINHVIRQKKWLILTEVGARQRMWAHKLEEARRYRHFHRLRANAASLIQFQWRRVKNAARMAEVTAALSVISRIVRRFMLRRRHDKKHQAADMIGHALNEVRNVMGIVTVIRNFRVKVAAAQRYSRDFLVATRARMQLQLRFWDHIEYEEALKKAHKRKAGTSSSRAAGSTPKQHVATSKGKSKGKGKDKGKSTPVRRDVVIVADPVPHRIKARLIRNDLRRRRKLHGMLMMDYLAKKKAWDIEAARVARLEEMRALVSGNADPVAPIGKPPERPHLRTLLPRRDMLEMIRYGRELHKEERKTALREELDGPSTK